MEERAEVSTEHISAVICTRNRDDKIGTAVESVLANDYPSFDLTVIDQSTTDATRKVVEPTRRRRSAACTTSTSTRPGCRVRTTTGSGGRTGAVLAFTDDDCIVAAGLAREHRQGLRRGTGRRPALRPGARRRRHAGRHGEDARPGHPRARSGSAARTGSRCSAWAPTSPPAARLFGSIGGFDAVLGGGGALRSSQDYDLAYRAFRGGRVILLRPDVTLRHDGRRETEDWPALLPPTAPATARSTPSTSAAAIRTRLAADPPPRRAHRQVGGQVGGSSRQAGRDPLRAWHAQWHPRQLQVQGRPGDEDVRRSDFDRSADWRRHARRASSDMSRVVILGAGPTGLGAAHRLAELGHADWDIFERTDHVGGLASSVTDPHGFIWDHGGHVMFSHYSYFDELVEKMLRGDYDQHMREAWVWIYGRFVPYPFQNNIHRLPPDVFLDCVMGIIESREQRQAGQLRRVDHVGLRRGHRRTLHAPVQLQGVGPPAGDDGHHVAGRPGTDRRHPPDPAEPDRGPRRRQLGAEQPVQVPAARHRHAVRAHRRVPAQAGSVPQGRGRDRHGSEGDHVHRWNVRAATTSS